VLPKEKIKEKNAPQMSLQKNPSGEFGEDWKELERYIAEGVKGKRSSWQTAYSVNRN
jgi:hypothetical protein